MKYSVLLILTFFTFQFSGISQEDTSKFHVSLGLNILRGIATFSGNNVINYSYKSKKSIDVSTGIRINKRYGFGFEYSKQYLKVKDTKYTGNHREGSMRTLGCFASYNQILSNRFIIESILSIGRSVYEAQGKIRNPYYGIGIRPKFRIWRQLYIIGGYNFQYHKFSINAPSDLKSFYNKGVIHNFNIGFSLN